MNKNFSKVIAATIATSAIVAPISSVSAAESTQTIQSGFYYAGANGEAGKYFTTTEFQNLDPQEKLNYVKNSDKLVVYLSGLGVAKISEVMTSGTAAKAFEANGSLNTKTPEKYFTGEFKGTDGKTVVVGEATPPVTGEVKVESVSAINAKQVQVTFNTPVDKDSVIAKTTSGGETAGTLVNGVFAFSTLDSKAITADSAKGELSTDGKTLTITASGTEVFEGRYDVTIDGAKDKDGKAVAKYEMKNQTFAKDTVAPTVSSTERVSSNKVKVKFSEPVVFSAGALTAKYADSTVAPALTTGDVTVGSTDIASVTSANSAPVSEITLNLNANVKENKDIVVTLNGVADTAGNLLNPQPATLTVTKLALDAVEPTISTVAQTGAKTFSIKFNKDLDGTTLAASDVTVGGTQAASMKKISASEYEFTMAANLDGLQTVTVAANKAVDLAGQKNTAALSKLVQFKVDAVAPKATAKLVKDKNNKEVIELTFDKDVTVGQVTVAGKQVKDYVTTDGISVTPTAVYADGTGANKKVVHIPLSASALAVEGAAYDVIVSSANVKSDAGKAMDDVKVQFTRGKDGQPENVNTHVVSNVVVAQGGDNNTVTATFTIPSGTALDGATATNVANYVIAGAEVESVSLATPSNATTQVATLKLKEGSNTFTGVRNITVKNVKVAGSTKVMEPKTITNVSLKENVRPTVAKSEVTAITVGSAQVPAVPATAAVTGTNAVKVTGTASDATTTTTAATGYKVVNNAGTLELQKADDNSVVNSNLATTQTFVQGAVTFTIAGAAAGDTFTVATKANEPIVPAVAAKTEITLTFSEAVTKSGAAVDFELFIGGEKSTATVATTAATGKTQLTLTANKALTAEDFAKGVQLKAVSTLDIADVVGNKLKLDGPINLTLN